MTAPATAIPPLAVPDPNRGWIIVDAFCMGLQAANAGDAAAIRATFDLLHGGNPDALSAYEAGIRHRATSCRACAQ